MQRLIGNESVETYLALTYATLHRVLDFTFRTPLFPQSNLWYNGIAGLITQQSAGECSNTLLRNLSRGAPMKDERYQYLHDWRMSAQAKDSDYLRRKALKELYHATVEWYDSKLFEQHGHCALCPATRQSVVSGKRLSVDHDHGCCPTKRACGKCNRGLLCFNCNKRLGILEIFMRESKVFTVVPQPNTWLYRAVKYLEAYAWQNAK
jgi:hypothetical protein